MVLGLVPDALDLRNLSSKSFVNFCELSEVVTLGFVASLTGFEPATRCLEGKSSNFRDFQTFRGYLNPKIRAKSAEAAGLFPPGHHLLFQVSFQYFRSFGR